MKNSLLIEWIGEEDGLPQWNIVKESDVLTGIIQVGGTVDVKWEDESSPAKILKISDDKNYLKTVLQKEFLDPQKRKEDENRLKMPRHKRKPEWLEGYNSDESADAEKTINIKKKETTKKDNIGKENKSKIKKKKEPTEKIKLKVKEKPAKKKKIHGPLEEIQNQKDEEKDKNQAIKDTEKDFLRTMMETVFPQVNNIATKELNSTDCSPDNLYLQSHLPKKTPTPMYNPVIATHTSIGPNQPSRMSGMVVTNESDCSQTNYPQSKQILNNTPIHSPVANNSNPYLHSPLTSTPTSSIASKQPGRTLHSPLTSTPTSSIASKQPGRTIDMDFHQSTQSDFNTYATLEPVHYGPYMTMLRDTGSDNFGNSSLEPAGVATACNASQHSNTLARAISSISIGYNEDIDANIPNVQDSHMCRTIECAAKISALQKELDEVKKENVKLKALLCPSKDVRRYLENILTLEPSGSQLGTAPSVTSAQEDIQISEIQTKFIPLIKGEDLLVDKIKFFQLQREVGTDQNSAEKILGGIIKLVFTNEELATHKATDSRQTAKFPPLDQKKCGILRAYVHQWTKEHSLTALKPSAMTDVFEKKISYARRKRGKRN